MTFARQAKIQPRIARKLTICHNQSRQCNYNIVDIIFVSAAILHWWQCEVDAECHYLALSGS